MLNENDIMRTVRRQAMHGTTILALLAGLASPALAEKIWDHTANVKANAQRAADLQQARGALGTFEYIASCYKTHSLASEFGSAIEGCMVVDYINSVSLSSVYARMTPEQRVETRVPDPSAIMTSMSQRLAATFQQYKLPKERFEAFGKLVEAEGLPVYSKARFKTGE